MASRVFALACLAACAAAWRVPVADWRFRRGDQLRASSRRELLHAGMASAALLPFAARATDDDFAKEGLTKLLSAQLPTSDSMAEDPLADVNWAAPKVSGLTTEEMAKRVEAGLRKECWFVSGRALPELFSESFTFSDPQVKLNGIEDYCRGVRRFYDQSSAVGEIVCVAVTAPETITIAWRNYGRVNIGPGVELPPYIVTTTLKTSAADGGLIVKQIDEFETNKAALLTYNLFPSRRPPLPPIETVACPLPKS